MKNTKLKTETCLVCVRMNGKNLAHKYLGMAIHDVCELLYCLEVKLGSIGKVSERIVELICFLIVLENISDLGVK